ncbi:hypothetical protein RGUI_3184 [Rhodovulum sp. P5]|uniref:hypothetical protein n=1 Tax=Rhodovulum sp. P5 TaxID=1564506 RepID=UPI0009C387AD|nr:hypothetical protein [Rhodovulum sp. P5]ARE41325.1 hypothetical protein RGUI_3184 [Rhodovulum sp. P5]
MRQVFGIVVTFAALLWLVWACLALIAGTYGVFLPLPFAGFARVVAGYAPALLLGLSLFARLRARHWRRLEAMRDAWPGGASAQLARGDIHVDPPATNRSGLEALCGLTITLALTAFPYRLGAARPELWVGAVLVLRWVMRG